MADINISKAPQNYAILPFYGMAAISFMLFTVLVLLSYNDFTGPYFQPHILAIVHTAALGWATMAIFGASYQMLPVICERDLYSLVLALFSFFCLTSGVIVLVFSFWYFRTGFGMITGGGLIVLSAISYLVNVLFTAGDCKRYNISKLFIVSSGIWLVTGTTIGLLLAINLWHPFISVIHLRYLKLHAHIGLAGWFLQLIIGVSVKLIPMFLLGKSQKVKYLKITFVLINLGLILFLIDGYFFSITPRVLFYALLIFTGVIFYILYLRDTYKNRVPRPLDFQMKHSFISLLCLVASFVVIPLLFFIKGYFITMLYGLLLFMGWITSIILGMTFKTLPFIVWNEVYKEINGKQKVPLPKDLYKKQLVEYQFYVFILAIASFAVSLILHMSIAILASACLWVLLAGIYGFNVFVVLFHKSKLA